VRDPYDSPISRALGILLVAVPVALVLFVAIGFRALGLVSGGASWLGALLYSVSAFLIAFAVWFMFFRARAAALRASRRDRLR